MKRNYGKIYLLLTFIAFILYGNTIKNDYALDDDFIFNKDSPVNMGIKGIPKILRSYHVKDESGNEYEYRPMVKISYALETSIFGNNVHVHHFFNIVYYAVCLILLFYMLTLLFENYSLQTIIWITVVFAFIPVHSEVVDSLKNRDVMLSFIFSMLVLIYFLKWLKKKIWSHVLIIALFFFCALASKFDALPLMAILPLVYIQRHVIDKVKVNYWRVIVNVLLIIFILFAMYVALKKGQKLLLDQTVKRRVFDYFENPLYFEKDFKYKVFTMLNTLGFYVLILMLPIKMSCYYGYNVIPYNSILNIYGITGIVSFCCLLYFFLKRFFRRDLLWYGIMFFGINLSMFMNFVRPVPGIVADRFLFAPSVGWSMILVYFIEYINIKYFERAKMTRFIDVTKLEWWHKGGIKWYILLYFFVLSVIIWYRNYEWRYKLYLYEADVKKYPESVKLHILYSSQIVIEYLQNTGRLSHHEMPKYLDIALNGFKEGLQIDSSCASCYNNIAYLLMNWKKDYEGSIPYLLKSYKYDSTRKELLTNIAISYFKTGRSKDTIELFIRRAIKADRNKNYEIPHDVMKEYCKSEKMYQKGIDFFQKELKERPTSQFLHSGLAELYVLNGDTLSAIKTYEKLLELNPNYPGVAVYLSRLREEYHKNKKKNEM